MDALYDFSRKNKLDADMVTELSGFKEESFRVQR